MKDELQEKINNLSIEQKRIYRSTLHDIYESVGDCASYGAKDPINLPESDINTIKQNLYREMFESGRYFVK